MSCGVGCRCGSDPLLLWLWCRLAAVALIQLLVWELRHAAGVALEKTKRQKKFKSVFSCCGADRCEPLNVIQTGH